MGVFELVSYPEGPKNLKVINLVNPKAPGFRCSTVGTWTLCVNFESYLNVAAWVKAQVETNVVHSAQLILNQDALSESNWHVVNLLVKGYLNRDGLTMMMRDFQRLGLDNLAIYVDSGPLKGRRVNQTRRVLMAVNPFAPIVEHIPNRGLHRVISRVEPLS